MISHISKNSGWGLADFYIDRWRDRERELWVPYKDNWVKLSEDDYLNCIREQYIFPDIEIQVRGYDR